MCKRIDITGQRFGKFVVLNRVENDKSGNTIWLCKCDCGNERTVQGGNLKNGRRKSCGCIRKDNTFDMDFEGFVVICDSKGNKCFVDLEELERVKRHTWCKGGNGYFVARIRNETVTLHRFLLHPNKNERVDHINNLKYDNRKFNLRICTQKENSRNTIKRKNTTSIYKGVYWNKVREKWACGIKYNGKQLHLGLFESEEEAGKKYDGTAKELFGEFAKLNFPK